MAVVLWSSGNVEHDEFVQKYASNFQIYPSKEMRITFANKLIWRVFIIYISTTRRRDEIRVWFGRKIEPRDVNETHTLLRCRPTDLWTSISSAIYVRCIILI